MTALIEHELAAHNKPNLHVSIVSAQHTVILTSTTFPILPNIHKFKLRIQSKFLSFCSKNSRWHLGTSFNGKLGSHPDD